MNRLIVAICCTMFSLHVNSQNYIPADKGSKVHFVIRNFGINTGGDLGNLKGHINFDPLNLAASAFEVTVDINTIDTDSENRDKELRSNKYFDAEKFPLILIKSVKISTANKPGWYYFTGSLNMHGVAKEIAFPFAATPQGTDYLFTGEFEINRLDYAVGQSSAVMSKTVKVSLTVLAKKS